jgi:ABC-type transport system involved in cytochrome bd biosynthesis fused ATPase/permease subunit
MDYKLMFFNGYTQTPTPHAAPYLHPITDAIHNAELSLIWWLIKSVLIYIFVRDVLYHAGQWVLRTIAEHVKSSLLYALHVPVEEIDLTQDEDDEKEPEEPVAPSESKTD